MEAIKIFVLNIDKETLDKAIEFLRSKDFEVNGHTDSEIALETFALKKYDIAIFGGGISGKIKEALKKDFVKINPEVEIIEHQSHPVDMYEEIQEAFNF